MTLKLIDLDRKINHFAGSFGGFTELLKRHHFSRALPFPQVSPENLEGSTHREKMSG